MRKIVATQVLPLLLMLPFCLNALSDVSTSPMERTEQEALYSVIGGFVGGWWNGSELYPDPCGWTPIQGVSCDLFDGLWYITTLSIGPILENSLECALDAKFDTSLFLLKELRSLAFFDCFSSNRPTNIPSRDWEKLSRSLETLEFRSNPGLIGEIPASIALLTNLESLVLVDNGLRGRLPPEFSGLGHLKRLSLAGNALSDQIPAALFNSLNELLILDLSRNNLSGPLPPSVGRLNSLLKLDFSGNCLTGELPVELGSLMNLTLLDLSNNNLSGGLTQALQGMASLQHMVLSNNKLGGDLEGFGWEILKNVTNLDLSNNGLTGEIPESITRLRRLRFLALDRNSLSGNVPVELAALPGLNALYLNGNNLTGELKFSQGFYERLGRRFAVWDNPHLCYNAGVVTAGHAPPGVESCKDKMKAVNHDSIAGNKVAVGGQDQGSASPINGFWWAVVLQGLVVVFLLLLLL